MELVKITGPKDQKAKRRHVFSVKEKERLFVNFVKGKARFARLRYKGTRMLNLCRAVK
jgi:hypothetical protein